MLLMFKEQFNCWVWTAEENPGYELSPRYNTQVEALQWRGDVSFEIHRDYSMLASGQRVVIPINRNHAHMILDNVVKYLQKEDSYTPSTSKTIPNFETTAPQTRTQPSLINVSANFDTPALPG
jgi:hypothetical protein